LEGDTPVLFDFVDSLSPSLLSGTDCTDLNVYFSPGNDDARFVYDNETKLYYKSQYNNTPQIDETNGEQIGVNNVFVLFARIESHGDITIDAFLDEGGTGYYVSEGKLINIMWDKDSPNSPIIISSENGETIFVNSGKSYICVVRNTRIAKTTWT
jgi:hypothetical protein